MTNGKAVEVVRWTSFVELKKLSRSNDKDAVSGEKLRNLVQVRWNLKKKSEKMMDKKARYIYTSRKKMLILTYKFLSNL